MYNSDLPTRAQLPSTRQLIRSTLIALVTAAALLVTVVLPAEYAIDPTGIGRMLGLTEMGEIKQQLAKEAAANEEASVQSAPSPAIAPKSPTEETQKTTTSADAETQEPMTSEDAPQWRDTTVITLKPGEAAEIKLAMLQGVTSTYEWTVDQGHLNSDLHGDGTKRLSTSYRKGRAETSDSGTLEAAFDGTHGWFWRNRSDATVTVTLKTAGAYTEIKRVV